MQKEEFKKNISQDLKKLIKAQYEL
jgi:hypothetical protein